MRDACSTDKIQASLATWDRMNPAAFCKIDILGTPNFSTYLYKYESFYYTFGLFIQLRTRGTANPEAGQYLGASTLSHSIECRLNARMFLENAFYGWNTRQRNCRTSKAFINQNTQGLWNSAFESSTKIWISCHGKILSRPQDWHRP